MQGTRRRLTTAAVLAATATLALTGCAQGGHEIGEGVTTKLNGSAFHGQLRITATKVERVTDAALDQFGLTSRGDDTYLAHFTVHRVSGTFDPDAVGDLANDAWGLRADDRLQAGPDLAASDRNSVLQDACPFDRAAITEALRSDGTADVCAVLLAPADSTVEAVTYLRAAPVDQGPEGDATITWRAA
ncbi:hypothetical protein ACLBWP_11725 [Microbacterium sp. M1A1_1b]|uniref:hypothetical protein n=1 Tax=Curtobacterium sp. VKM Ac-2922 TaxID=2929475 RepID=UPI001FB4C74F|nr:hypothetical protein [Curtobacterium sp. VKM Ac-2922]MCJ1712804.1 hypothetical protein [Curtobacterium sp. VKM Ac-2922]